MKKTIQSKALALFMAVLIAVMCSPFAFADEPIALTEANITEYPVASGEIFYGQKVGEGIILSGGSVSYEGTVVPGKFEHADNEFRPTAARNNTRASIKFVPEDSTAYTSFQINNCANVTYNVKHTTPVFVDKENNPLVATKVEMNATLSTSVLSGGQCCNPYNPEDTDFLNDGIWSWTNGNTVITASGMYEANFIPGGRAGRSTNILTEQVYVKVIGDVPNSLIKENPTMAEFTYDGVTTWGEIELTGGKAVSEDDGTEIEGTFSIISTYKDVIANPSMSEIEVIFTPSDPEKALPASTKIPANVNPATVAFKDADGNAVIEGFEYEVEPNEKMSNVLSRIKHSIIAPENTVWKIEDNNGYAKNGQQYKITLIYQNSYYTGTELTFTAKFKEINLEPNFTTIGGGKWQVQCKGYTPKGTFTVYAILNGVETKIGEAKGDETITWKPEATGEYTFRIEYTRAEEDYFVINNVTSPNLPHNPDRYFTATGTESTAFKMGQTVKAVAPATDPAMAEKPYYGFVGWTVVSGNPDISAEQLESAELEFAMPDENVELKATYKFDFIMFIKYVFSTIVNWFKGVFASIGTLF